MRGLLTSVKDEQPASACLRDRNLVAVVAGGKPPVHLVVDTVVDDLHRTIAHHKQASLCMCTPKIVEKRRGLLRFKGKSSWVLDRSPIGGLIE